MESEMGKSPVVWMNGELIPRAEAVVPLLSHGFSRASAFFDVFGIHPGPRGPMAFRMDEHLKRLETSARLLEMELAYSTEQIIEAVKVVVEANSVDWGLVKILAYWGAEAVSGLVPTEKLDMAVFAIPESEGLNLGRTKPKSACLSKWRKIHPETVPVQDKSCSNYLHGYLVRKDALNRGFDLGITLDTTGFLAEGSIESVFIVKDGVLKTPPLGRVLASISRKSILEAAPEIGIATSQDSITPAELYGADEIFTCRTGVKVEPIARLEDRILPAPGPVTKKISRLMDSIIAFEEERFGHWFQPVGR